MPWQASHALDFVLFPHIFMMISFKYISMLSWNIWEANNKRARRYVMDLIRKFSPTFLVIMETHVVYAKLASFWERAGYKKIAAV